MTMIYHGTNLTYARSIAKRGAILSYFQQNKEFFEEAVRRGNKRFGSSEELEATALDLTTELFTCKDRIRATHVSVSTDLELSKGYTTCSGLVLGIDTSNDEMSKWLRNGINPAYFLVPALLPLTNLKEIHLSECLIQEQPRIAKEFERFNPSFFYF